MKKFIKLFGLLIAVTLIATSCGGGTTKKEEAPTDGAQTNDVLKIGATAIPHAELLDHIKPTMKEKGIDLEVTIFSDYVTPNTALTEGSIDANFFQHKPYMDNMKAEKNLDLEHVANIHIEPMGIYSQKIKSLDELTDGATVSIPNDPTNGGRALMLLEKSGLIKLKDSTNLNSTPNDVVENAKNLNITAMDAAQLPRTLQDVDISVINSNYALEGGLNPVKDSIFTEPKDSPYANIIATRAGLVYDLRIKTLVETLQSDDVKKFIEEKYQGAIIPAF